MKISIVTISFNQAAYLDECIQSVAEQTHGELQYIVVDPGSTDGSREIIREQSEAIDLAVLEPDSGPADGLNKGFARADGEVLGYLNADDRFAPGALAIVDDYFRSHPDVDVLCGAIRLIDERGRASPRKRTSDLFNLARYAAGVCNVNQQATFFRREAFQRAGGFNPENRIAWDGELLVDMALAGCRFATIAKVLGDFRVYAESITGSGLHRQRQLEDLARLRDKIQAAGVSVYSPMRTRIKRLLYKANVRRHLGYLVVR